MDSEDKIPMPPVEPGDKFFKWLDNFWYHYKWHTIFTIFIIIVLSVGIFQVAGKETPDVGIMYAGPRLLSLPEKNSMQSAVRQVMEDYNGDDKLGVELVSLMIMSEEQIKKAYEDAEEQGKDILINAQFIREETNKFDNLTLAGDSVLCFLDPYLYERVLSSGGFMPLSEVFDEIPEAAIDEYGVKLSETKFGQYFAGFNVLPDDTVLCIRRISTFSFIKGKNKTELYHSYHVSLLRSIMAFEFPAGYTPETADTQS